MSITLDFLKTALRRFSNWADDLDIGPDRRLQDSRIVFFGDGAGEIHLEISTKHESPLDTLWSALNPAVCKTITFNSIEEFDQVLRTVRSLVPNHPELVPANGAWDLD